MKRACKECEFFEKEGGSQYKDGTCRCHAATWQWQAEDYEDVSGWPQVRFDEWCGEFEQREEEKDQPHLSRADFFKKEQDK